MATVTRQLRAGTAAVAVVIALLCSGSAAAQAALGVAPQPWLAIEDIPLAQVASGMRGYALTAGPGNAIERFDVEVVSVQRDALSALDLVLIRVSGPFIDRSGGVAAGMSGSPVYLDLAGRTGLLGAVAYVFANADHRLALVTPIEAMRAVQNGALGGPLAYAVPLGAVEVAGVGSFVPVATPILMSGADARAAAFVDELFRTAAVTPLPMQAAAAPAPASEPFDLVPGAAVAAQLARGDVELSAVGTVTSIDADGLLAFGHPFLGLGRASLPLAPAFVTAIVGSSVVPFKLANVGQGELGVVTSDRPAGLWASFGPAAAMLSVSVTVNGPEEGGEFAFEVVNDERLYPNLIAIGVLRLADRMLERVGSGSAAISWHLELSSGITVDVLEQLSDPGDVAFATALTAAAPFAILADNQFAAAELRSAAIVIDLSEEQNHASLEDVVVETSPLVPGSHALLHLRLQPHRRPAYVRTLSVPLPSDLGDSLTIVVRGGDVPLESDKLADEPQEEDGGPRSFGELLDALREQYQASEIVVEAITLDGKVRRLARLPAAQVVTGSHELELTLDVPLAGAPDSEPEQAGEGEAKQPAAPGAGE